MKNNIDEQYYLQLEDAVNAGCDFYPPSVVASMRKELLEYKRMIECDG